MLFFANLMVLCAPACTVEVEPLNTSGCVSGQLRCVSNVAYVCAAGEERFFRDCSLDGELCSDTDVCVAPIVDACELARGTRSYLGCEYFAVPAPNPLLVNTTNFQFGVVIANTGDELASVHISRGDTPISEHQIASGDAETIVLPWIDELLRASERSTLLRDGSYHIVSNRPVAVYQYNPLTYRSDASCTITNDFTHDRDCFSFTADASLLLPVEAYDTSYIVDGVPGTGYSFDAFVAIVAPQASTVRVLPRSTVMALSGADASPLATDTWSNIVVEAGSTLLLRANTGSLSGTEIESNAPVMVLSGHSCAKIPSTFAACDHLEEVVPPLRSWGTNVVAAVPRSFEREPVLMRVLSSTDGNRVHISSLTDTVIIDRGESFEMVTSADLQVVAESPVLVTQYLVGAQFFNRGSQTTDDPYYGDPAVGFVPPVAQFRREYTFVAPPSYDHNFVALVARGSDEVWLDGVRVEAWSALANTDYSAARIEISAGVHRITSELGVGVTMYAVAPFTSYLLPAGLNVELLQ